MDIDIAAAYDAMVKIVIDAGSVNAGMAALIDYCDAVFPHTLWSSLRTLHYAEDEERLRQWLVSVFTDEPIPLAVKTFWFGMFNPMVDDEVSCALYVSGSTRDYSPDSLDWACFRQDTYRPSQYVAESQILHTIYCAVQEEPDAVLLAEYVLCLGYACLVISAILRTMDAASAAERVVVVGFDGGDNVLLGSLAEFRSL